MMTSPTDEYGVDIIIVNWNTGVQLQKALAPLANQSEQHWLKCNTIIVDNGSIDNSLETVKDQNVKIILNQKNLGFGRACNKAYPFCKSKLILLLNPDVEWELKTLEELAIVLINDSKLGAIGPRQVDKAGQTQTTCGRFPVFSTALWEITGLSKILPKIFTPAPIMFEWEHNESRLVDHVMGSFMLIKKEVIEKTGFFDERYFMYYEDLDLSRKMHKAGYKSYYEHSQSIFHEGGGTSKQVKAKRLFYSLHSRLLYYKKHFSAFEIFLLIIPMLLIEPFFRTLQAVLQGDAKRVKQTWIAYFCLVQTLFSRKLKLTTS